MTLAIQTRGTFVIFIGIIIIATSINLHTHFKAFPGSPQNILARETSAGSCEILVTWDPPTNIDRSDIDRYMVYVPSRNMMEIEFSTTTILVVPNCCSDDTLSLQVAAMNRFGCVGPNSSPTQLRLMELPTTTSVNTVSPGKYIVCSSYYVYFLY